MNDRRSAPLSLYTATVIGLIFFSFLMAALISRTVFERLPHLEDEMAYLFQARIFARGDVVVDIPPHSRAFWQPFVITYAQTGSRFGKYTPGWPALLAAGVAMGQPWVINAFFAALTVALAYRLGRELFNPDVGLVAAALTAFSPMALLLNATLMGHTAALCCTTLFLYAYRRMERGHRAQRWGLLAGLALGLLVANRPLTAMGVALPFILWSALRILATAWSDFRALRARLAPLIMLSVLTLAISAAVPAYNYAATHDATKNLYTLVWQYDRVGFGLCCGRSSTTGGEGHTIIKGIRHARFDLSLTAADLFGWQLGSITPQLQDHLRNNSDYWPLVGISWILLPFGLLIGFREQWLQGWILAGMAWLIVPLALDMKFLNTDKHMIWLWLAGGAGWLMIPPVACAISRKPSVSSQWTWLLLAVVVGLIGVHLTYWIGSQRYSTRYYFEALTALALISALPIAAIARRFRRLPVYGLLLAALVYSLYAYSTPRISALHRFNAMSPALIEAVRATRQADQPILVIVSGPFAGENRVSWRAYGPLMAVTGPYLDDEIVVARNYAPGTDLREQLIAMFPGRQVIDLQAEGNTAWIVAPSGG